MSDAGSYLGLSPDVLVLGGSGFIGTRLASLMVDQHISTKIGDLKKSLSFPHLWEQCDVRNASSIAAVSSSAHAIINLAAEHRDDVHPVSRYYETNVHAASQVCAASRAVGIQKIIFTSSVAVYGFRNHSVSEEGPFTPFNDYGKSKLEAEAVYRAWAEEDPSRTLVIIRPTVVFGEGNRGNVYNLLRQIASRRFFMVGPGNNFKSMAYVGNVAAFLLHSLSFGSGVHIFNYVDLPDMSTKELVEHVRVFLGRSNGTLTLPRPIAMAGAHVFDAIAGVTGRRFPISAVRIRKFCANTQFSAERVLRTGFLPPYSLADGLDRTIRSEFPLTRPF